MWPTTPREKHTSKYGSISTVVYSDALDLIAISGVRGVIYLLDQETKSNKGSIQAHSCEIMALYFYDQQHQLISVSQQGDVGLLDAQKYEKIQILRNSPNMTQKVLSACTFYERLGRILLASSKVFNYDLEVDNDIKIFNE